MSDIGKLVDMPIEEFRREIVDQKVNVGTINTLILNLEGAYHQLIVAKDSLIASDSRCTEAGINVVEGLYAEMTKIELKVVFLKKLKKEYLEAGNQEN